MSRSIEEQRQDSVTTQVPGPRPSTEALAETPTASDAEPAAVGDPGMIGLPVFLVGSVALGLVLVGFVPAAAAGASIPIIMTATGVGLLVAATWAARLAQSAVAGVFAIFAGFWLSYAALVLGLTHGWFGIATTDVVRTEELFLIAWVVVIGLLTVGSIRLPLAFTVLFALVELALVLDLLGTINASAGLLKTAGWVVFAFVAVGAYLFLSGLSAATGGRPYPLGRPALH
jgi:succinate-acetate transporter protein